MRFAVTMRSVIATVASAGLLAGTIGTAPVAADTSRVSTTSVPAIATAQVGAAYTAIQLPAAAKKASSKRITTARLNLRRGPGRSHRVIKVLRKGQAVTLLGRSARGFVNVTAAGSRGWVSKRYLTKPRAKAQSSGGTTSRKSYGSTERRLTAKTIRVHRALRAAFPRIKTVHGYRPGSAGEHRLGRALDVMLPGNYRSASARALGKSIATWARSRAKQLNIYYVIWDQRIWNTQRAGDGWRKMRNGGSASANHKNHVHISVKR